MLLVVAGALAIALITGATGATEAEAVKAAFKSC